MCISIIFLKQAMAHIFTNAETITKTNTFFFFSVSYTRKRGEAEHEQEESLEYRMCISID